MIKSEKLEILCNNLYKYPPSWEAIVGRFKSHPKFDAKKSFHVGKYANYFSEIHLDISLEEIAEENVELGINLQLIEEHSESDFYLFKYSLAGRLFVYSTKGKKITEYDKLIFVGELPVIFEVKLSRWSMTGTRKRINKAGIKQSLRPEVYRKRLCPIRQLFGQDVGYVMIIPKDIYDARNGRTRDSIYNRFQEKGGIIVPFYTDRQNFRQAVLRQAEGYGLKLKT